MATLNGFENEIQLGDALNNKRLSEIKQSHLKEFIIDMYDNTISESDLVFCEKVSPQSVTIKEKKFSINVKQDLIVTVNGIQRTISVKKGSNNSVHEESIETFIEFLKSLGAQNNIINSLLKYQWADGTLDNTGKPEARLKGKDVTTLYPNEMMIVHNFFNDNRIPILKRALSIGTYDASNSQVDYIYHGTIEGGVWCSLDYALSINDNPDNTKRQIAIGFLTYQNQNRNTTLNQSKEHARKQIQFKWSNMEAILEKSMKVRSRLKDPIKVIGNNRHGFENVKMIQLALNGSKIEKLRPNLKRFIQYLFPQTSSASIVTCDKISNMEKGSLDITVGSTTKRVLIKSGSGNSIHQEDYAEFYKFLMDEFKLKAEILDAFKIIQWGDGTLDGSGDPKNWLHAREIKNIYPEQVKLSNEFVKSEVVARKLLQRFLVTGKNKNAVENEYIYFGDIDSAYWASTKDIIELQIKNRFENPRPLLNIGNVNLQSWGRTIKKSTNIDQRESLQVKMSQLESDIKLISKTSKKRSYYEEGEASERSFVQIFNSRLFKKTTLPMKELADLLMEPNGYRYAVQVQTRQVSSLTNKKENTKSDTYFIEAKEPLNELLLYERDFYIGEDDLENVSYFRVPKSGVSIKRSDSTNFTYAKFGKTSFAKLFDDRIDLFVGALFYVQNERDFPKNYKILSDHQMTYEEIIKKFQIVSTVDELTVFKQIKDLANKTIKSKIEKNKRIYEAVFFGKGVFIDPYSATYLYTDELVHKNELMNQLPFSVTTGSGRSKGKYTIIIKPN